MQVQEKEILAQKRVHSLDVVRFLAFLLVFCSHFPSKEAWYEGTVFFWGTAGVSLFFVLSGYLIAFSLQRVDLSTPKGWIHFYIKRLFRIFPMYLVGVILAYILEVENYIGEYTYYYNRFYEPNWWSLITFSENYFFISHATVPAKLPLMVIWTLCIEMHFYLLAPILIKLFKALGNDRTLFILLLASVVARIYHGWQRNLTVDIFSYLDHFALGMYMVLSSGQNFKLKKAWHLMIVVSVFLIVLTFSGFIYVKWATFYALLWPGVLALAAVALISFALSIQIKANNPLSLAGKYTYSLYLLHTLVIGIIIYLPFEFNYILGFLIALFLSVLLSFLSYQLIERPSISFSRRLLARRP